MPPKIADAIRILAAETLEGCSNDWSDSAKADEVLRAVYDLIFEAGVQAERELWTAELQRLIDKYQKIHDEREPEAVAVICGTALGHADELRAALAVVTGKEGASDER